MVDGAVNIYDGATFPTHQMMVVVADAVLVERWEAARLDPSDDALVGERAECVVHGLAGDRPEGGAGPGDDLVGGGVLVVGDGIEHGEALCRHVQAMAAQRLAVLVPITHRLNFSREMDYVQILIVNR